MSDIETHTIAVLVDNEPGVLARVIGLFSGRGYNIESLTVAEVDAASSSSRITIVTSGTPMIIEQIKAQLARLVPVHAVRDLDRGRAACRARAGAHQDGAAPARSAIESLRLADIFRARVVDSTTESFVFEMTGSTEKLNAFINLMEPLGPGRCLAHRRRRDLARRAPNSESHFAGGNCRCASITIVMPTST